MRKPKTRAEMIDFLSNHFRYSTMNSWNGESSYAANVKLHRLNIPREIQDNAYALLDTEEAHERIGDILNQFARDHNWEWQAGFNGRSGGYIVLYQGGRKLSGYKSCCTACGQRNFKTVEETKNKTCGVCHKETRANREFYETFTKCAGIDEDKDYSEWDIESLRARADIVRSFDELVKNCIAEWLSMARDFKVVDESYTVTKTRKVLKEV